MEGGEEGGARNQALVDDGEHVNWKPYNTDSSSAVTFPDG